jgi:hypothetical protein
VAPGITLRAFLFSEPIDAGSVVADGDGNAVVVTDLPGDFAAGAHHLQLNTATADGDPISIAIALEVGEPAASGDVTTWLLFGGLAVLVVVAGTAVVVRRRKA